MINIRVELNEIENGKTIEKIIDTKSWIFEISKTDKPLGKKREKIPIIRNYQFSK